MKNEKNITEAARIEQKYNELKSLYNCDNTKIMSYLLSLEDSKVSKGAAIVEKKLKSFLYLGYTGQITPHVLRWADYGNNRTIGLSTVKNICNLYKDEIKKHNEKNNNNARNSANY